MTTKLAKTPLTALKRARQLLAKRDVWTQGTYAGDDGNHKYFCAVGALNYVTVGQGTLPYTFETDIDANQINLAEESLQFLQRAVARRDKTRIADTDVEDWNDRGTRTVDQVLAAYDLAIELAEKAKAKK